MLLAQNDGNASLVLAGQASGLVRLMGLFGARPQIETKVQPAGRGDRRLSVGCGRPGDQGRHCGGADAVRRMADAIDCGRRRSREALPYPGASIEKDFAWSPTHPVVDAYPGLQADALRRADPGARGGALRRAPGRRYFTLSPNRARSRCRTTAGRSSRLAPTGRHRYLIVDPAKQAAGHQPLHGAGLGATGPTARPPRRWSGARPDSRPRPRGLILGGADARETLYLRRRHGGQRTRAGCAREIR